MTQDTLINAPSIIENEMDKLELSIDATEWCADAITKLAAILRSELPVDIVCNRNDALQFIADFLVDEDGVEYVQPRFDRIMEWTDCFERVVELVAGVRAVQHGPWLTVRQAAVVLGVPAITLLDRCPQISGNVSHVIERDGEWLLNCSEVMLADWREWLTIAS